MRRQYETVTGAFTALGRAADDTLDIAGAIRSGRLTRRQFDEWMEKRRDEGQGLVITLRDKASGMLRPVEIAMARGEELLRSVAPAPVSRRRHSRRRRIAVRRHRKSKAK